MHSEALASTPGTLKGGSLLTRGSRAMSAIAPASSWRGGGGALALPSFSPHAQQPPPSAAGGNSLLLQAAASTPGNSTPAHARASPYAVPSGAAARPTVNAFNSSAFAVSSAHTSSSAAVTDGAAAAAAHMQQGGGLGLQADVLDAHLGKVRRYYEAKVSELEAALQQAQAESSLLRRQMETIVATGGGGLAGSSTGPSMALGPRLPSSSPGKSDVTAPTDIFAAANNCAGTTSASSMLPAQGSRFFASVLAEVRASRASVS